MFDIADKLFPNLLTLLAQLAATGIIYVLYRKYVHQPVMDYLDRRADELESAQNYAKEVEEEALEKSKALEREHQEKLEALSRSQKALKQEAEEERNEIIKNAEAQKDTLLQQAQYEIDKERSALIKEVEDYVLNLAVNVTERALENYSYDESDMYQSLEKELEQMNNETH